MNNAPVILFVYNRPQHTRLTLEALSRAEGAEHTSLIVYADAPRTEADKPLADEVAEIVSSQTSFKSVQLIRRPTNMGLARNIIEALSDVFASNETAIVLEDDLVVSTGFLNYMNAALEFYRDRNVFSVSGYTPDVHVESNYGYSTYCIMRNCSWGWATWRSKWLSVDWSVGDFDSFVRDARRRKEFDASGTDLSAMLLKWRTGEINSWSIRFCYASFVQHQPTVYPVASLVDNIGADGSGTNVGTTNKYLTRTVECIDTRAFLPTPDIDERILASFRATYNCSLIRRIINTVKRLRYIHKSK